MPKSNGFLSCELVFILAGIVAAHAVEVARLWTPRQWRPGQILGEFGYEPRQTRLF